MSKKPFRINGKDVVIKAENVLYTNNGMAGVADAKGALDNLNDRVEELEENGGGGSSVVVEGSAVPMTNNDKVAFNIQRVFIKDNFVASSSWDIKMEDFIADEAVAFSGGNFTLYIEAQAGGTSLGAGAITNISMSLFSRTNLNGFSWNHVWDGKKDIYSITATNVISNSTSDSVWGVFAFGLHGANGKNLKISAYADYGGKRFYCKTCSYSADSSTLEALSYRLEWPDSAVSVDKVDALIDNHQLPFCSAQSEYDPFLAVYTTPRVIVTIVSDDGDIQDYTMLHAYLKDMAQTNGVDIRWSVAIPSNFVSYKETLRPSGATNERMTARMVRDLVGNYGVSVLAHNYGHEVMNSLTDAEAWRVCINARRQLERKVGVPCIHHCLPGGGYNPNAHTFDQIKKVFISTATIDEGINTPTSDRFKIYRNGVYGMSQADLLQKITDAEALVSQTNKSAWVCYYTHGHELANHMYKIQAITQYCVTNGIAMRNYSEAYAEIYPPLERLKSLLGIS